MPITKNVVCEEEKMAKTLRCTALVIVWLWVMLQPPEAVAGIPGFFTARADEESVTISYLLPVLGAKTVTVSPGNPATIEVKVLNNPLATVTLSMEGLSETMEGVVLHYRIQGQTFPSTEGEITVPFGEIGAELNFFGILPMLPGTGDIEVTLLLLKNRASYYIAADLPAFSIEPWSGTATPENNQTVRQITVQTAEGEATADITVTFSWDIPGSTAVSFEAVLTPVLPEGMPDGFDNQTVLPPIQAGPIPLPNGSYHLWFKKGAAPKE